MELDTTVELRYTGGHFFLETHIPGAVLSYPLGCYTNIRFTTVDMQNSVFAPDDFILRHCRMCENRNRGLVVKTTGLKIGPSVYQCLPSGIDPDDGADVCCMRVLSPIVIPDELPLDQLFETFESTAFPTPLIWAELSRINDVRNHFEVQPSDAWARLEAKALEAGLTPGELTGEQPKYFCGNA